MVTYPRRWYRCHIRRRTNTDEPEDIEKRISLGVSFYNSLGFFLYILKLRYIYCIGNAFRPYGTRCAYMVTLI